jgi:hypothetical protein
VIQLDVIHRSAWKVNSGKLTYSILHNPGPVELETVGWLDPKHSGQYYNSWYWIKMRYDE